MKALTANIANYDDHPGWETRKQYIAELFVKEQPDVIMLQEVRFNPQQMSCRRSYLNTAEEVLVIMQQFPIYKQYSCFTQPVMHYSYLNNGIFWEGKSFITAHAVLETGNIFLPQNRKSRDGNKRSLFWLKIEHNGQEYCFCNLHWSTDLQNHPEAVSALVELAGRFCDIPFICAGDFNSDFTANELFPENLLTDLWKHIHPEIEGQTFPSKNPGHRIDRIMANNIAVELADNINICGSDKCSDHLFVSLELNN